MRENNWDHFLNAVKLLTHDKTVSGNKEYTCPEAAVVSWTFLLRGGDGGL